ncbi:DJ-1/PfpI family protein [Photorhabdus asymbiotica]|uniref:DJ-1/PfpI family protein n=1 Tax=Photorhabdus asymbiotica TaxID=291112 RepID=UPI003DA77DAA
MSNKMTIVMPVYNGVTQLDFTGPHQFFSRVPDVEVIVASVDGQSIAADGLHFASLADLTQLTHCDILCVPGGSGCVEAMQSPHYMHAVKTLAQSARYITSVCSGSLILGAAGLLVDKRAACHWSWRSLLSLFGAISDSRRVVKDGNIITGGGVTAGIDFALTVIAEIYGEETAQSIQLGLEYAPSPPFNAGRPETAPVAIREMAEKRVAASIESRRALFERIAQSF